MERKEVGIVGSSSIKKLEYINPFPGLRPFNFDESHLFFGREGQSDEILLNLAKHRFTAVIGASGSGKSSLMFCGLIPVLYGGFMTNAGSDWTVLVTRPGIAPIENLADSILSKDEKYRVGTEEDKAVSRAVTSTILRSSSMGLIDAVKQIAETPDKNIFLLIDQFEELFRYIKNGEADNDIFNDAAAYVNLLIKSIQQREVSVYVAMTMRSDFIGDCSQFPELTHLINRSHYLIPQMTREQKRRIIEGPIAVGGAAITKRLVQQLLNDVGNNPDQLPVLQHALMRTWDHWRKNNHLETPIDIGDYKAVGKINEALSQHANETYATLTDEEKRICEVLFKALTEKGPDNQGLRRSAKLADIAAIAGVQNEEVIHVVEKFKKEGGSLLTTQGADQLDGDSIIEISHESLMRIWGKLKQWVEEESESASQYKRLAEAAAMHQVGKTGLWRPPELTLAKFWRDRQDPTEFWAKRYSPDFERAIKFLTYSQEEYDAEQERKRRLDKERFNRTRNIAIILGIAAVVSIFFFVFGWIKKMDADEQRKFAVDKQLEAESNAKLAEQRRLDAIFERGNAETQRDRAEAALKEADSARYVALKNADQARYQQLVAKSNEDRALLEKARSDSLRLIAQDQTKIAIDQSEKAYRLRMLSIAQSMSVKSQNVKDLDLKMLLAYHAFLLNRDYKGDVYDNYIYDGLYYAKKDKLKQSQNIDFNSFKQHSDMIRTIEITRDGKHIYTSGSDGMIIEWDGRSFSKTRTILEANNHINYILKLSQDEKWLMVGGDASYVLAINLQSGEVFKLNGHEGPVSEIINLPNSEYFLSLGIADKTLRINDVANTSVFKQFDDRLTALAINPNGSVLVGGNEKGELFVWDTKNMDNSKVYDDPLPDSPIYALEFDPSGRILAVGNEDGEVLMFSVKGQSLLHYYTLRGQDARINHIKFSNNGELLATASFDGSIQLWVLEDMEQMLPIAFKDHKDFVWNIDFSPDSRYLLAGTRDGVLKVWPTRPEYLADDVCKYLVRNMSRPEWQRYVGEDIPYTSACKVSDIVNESKEQSQNE